MTKKLCISIFILITVISGAFAQNLKTVTFSFASDDNHDGPTFRGSDNYIVAKEITVDLMVDRNEDKKGGTVTILSQLVLEGKTYDYRRYFYGGQWLHVWRFKGYAEFSHFNGGVPMVEPLLKIKFERAVITSISRFPNTTGETMTLQTSEPVDPGLNLNPTTLLPGINVTPATIVEHEDVTFTFTNIKTPNGNQTIPLNNSGYFLDKWTSEGSFSASGRPN